ncbi:MAG TPA: hypothetical protein VJR89_12620, partial [Polyangiales bacterium]|nr:hypothetical protein [Polyangiales bacterium]
SGRSRQLLLRPLDRRETQRLLASLFGDVANVELLAKEIHDIAAGNPRTTMDLAQHLVDRGVLHYAAGSWTLPSKLSADDLPRSAEAALLARIARMSPEAQALAKTHALAFYERMSLADYRALSPSAAAGRIDQAVSELIAEGALVYDGSQYRLANRLWTAALASGVDTDTARELHRALVTLYREQAAVFAIIHHALAAGDDALAIETLNSRAATATTTDHKRALEENVTKLAPSYGRIVRAAQRLGRSAREVNELRRAAIAASIASEEDCFSEHAGPWLAQLERDCGLDLWRADATNGDAGDRLTKALTGAHARHLATPEVERVYTIEEGIRRLCEFVTYSVAIAGRAVDHRRIATLPALLEPFAPLSPVIDALRNNVLGAHEAYNECRPERAMELWRRVLQTLETTDPAAVAHLDAVRNAVRYAIAMSEVLMGRDTVELHAVELEKDPYQRLSALALRKIARLQQGDWLGADRLRREAENVALQMSSPPMFYTFMAELHPYYHAGDLSGMQRTIDGLKVLAGRYPGYEIYLRDAQARFERVRGDVRAARLGFEECVRRTALNQAGESPCLTVWIGAHAGLSETLFDLGEHEAARRCASEALAVCEARGIDIFAYDLKRALALYEAKLGETERACERLDGMIRTQTERGVGGMRLGLSTEARARVAIWMGDRATFEHYAALTAREYRHGANSPLGGRYQRLVQEATRQGMQTTFHLSDFLTSAVLEEGKTALHDVHGVVLRVMAGAQRVEQRASQALRLLCESRGATSGHLFLSESEGFRLRASHAAAEAPEGLHVLAHEYLLKQQAGTDLISDMVTGELESESPQATAAARIDGVDYELLLLRCAVGGVGHFAGVAAVVAGRTQAPLLPDSVLLATLATHFVQAGDVETDS